MNMRLVSLTAAAAAMLAGCVVWPSRGELSFELTPATQSKVINLSAGVDAYIADCESPLLLYLDSEVLSLSFAFQHPSGPRLVRARLGEGDNRRYFYGVGLRPGQTSVSTQDQVDPNKSSEIIGSAKRDRKHWHLDLKIRADLDEYRWLKAEGRFSDIFGKERMELQIIGRVPALATLPKLAFDYCDYPDKEITWRAPSRTPLHLSSGEGETP